MKSNFNPSDAVPGNKTCEHRCFCGQLLARSTPYGVEIKCKRCKRIEVIPWEAGTLPRPA